MNNSLTKRVLSPREFQQTYRISHTSFYREIASGRLKPVRFGRKVLITADEAERWLAALPPHDGGKQ